MKDNFFSKYGPWALVTGASSGMGREFALQLAAKGFNLVLTGRSEAQLQATAKAIPQVETLLIPLDLSKETFLRTLTEKIGDREIGLAVCAAGVGHFGRFLDGTQREMDAMIRLNIDALLQITRHFGQRLAERGGGGIIVFSSTLGATPVPFGAIYSASKSFINMFGQALNYELRPKNIDVLTFIPGGTDTEMVSKIDQDIDINSMGMPLAAVAPVVSSALNNLGHHDKLVPGPMNKMMVFMMERLFSSKATTKLIGGMMAKSLRAKT